MKDSMGLMQGVAVGIRSIGAYAPYVEFVKNAVVLDDLSVGIAIQFEPVPMDGRDPYDLIGKMVALERTLSGFPPHFSLQVIVERSEDYRPWIAEVDLQLANLEKQEQEPRKKELLRSLLLNRKSWLMDRFRQGFLKNDRYYLFLVNISKESSLICSFQDFMNYIFCQRSPQIHTESCHGRIDQTLSMSRQIITALNDVGAKARLLEQGEVITVVQRYLSLLDLVPESRHLVDQDSVFAALYSGEYQIGRDWIYSSGRFASAISMMGMPILEGDVFNMTPCTFRRIYGEPYNYYSSFSVDLANVQKLSVDFEARAWQAKVMSKIKGLFLQSLNPNAVTADDIESRREMRLDVQSDELSQAKLGIDLESKKFGFCAMTTVMTAPTLGELKDICDNMVHEFDRVFGTVVRRESFQNFYNWMSSLPFCGYRSVRKRTDSVESALKMASLMGAYYGNSKRAMMCFSNDQSGMVRYHPYDLNAGRTLFNKVIVARAGSGKSFLANHLIVSMLLNGALIYIIDVGGSYWKLCRLLDGNYISVRGNRGQKLRAINPFYGLGPLYRELKSKPEDTDLKEQFMVQKALALRVLEVMLREEGKGGVAKEVKGCMDSLLSEFVEGWTEEFTLEDVRDKFQDVSILQPYYHALAPFCAGGAFDGYFNRKNELTFTAGFTVFDLEGVHEEEFKELKDIVMLVLTNFLLTEFYKFKDIDKLMIVDEAQEVLRSDDTARVVENAFRRHRKLRGVDVIISQSIRDFDKPAGKVILQNSDEFFLLSASEVEIPALKELVGWTDAEDYIIREGRLRVEAGKYSTAYMRSATTGARSLLRLSVPSFEYWLYTTHPPDNKRLAEAIKANNGDLTAAIESLVGGNSGKKVKSGRAVSTAPEG